MLLPYYYINGEKILVVMISLVFIITQESFIVAVLSPTLSMNEFRHSPYWKHRFVMRVQFFKGTLFNHVTAIHEIE